MKPWGALRATAAVLAGAGLVWGATQATGTADTTRRSDVRAASADTTSGRVTEMSLACTGADLDGSIEVASAPAGWMPKPAADGTVRVQGATTGPLELRHGAAAAAKLPSGVTGTVTASGGLASGLVAGQLQLDQRSTSRGLTLSNCSAPVQSGWFFGGGDQKGRVARLVLTNPAATPTTVDASVLGADGVDTSASVAGTVLAPGQRKVLTLGDFGPALAAAAVHVTASGAGVVASLTDAWMTGETPVGESTSSNAMDAAQNIVIPAVSASQAAPVVRLAVPGSEQAIVRTRAISTSGAVAADRVTTVAGETTSAIDLTGLAVGSYAVEVTADVPVVAAVMSRTGTTGTTDLSWSTEAPLLKHPAGIALPSGVPGGSATLMLTADTASRVEVVTTTSSGDTHSKTVVVPVGRAVTTGVDDARAVWLRPVGGGAVYAAVTVTGRDASGDFLAALPVQPVTLSQATSRLVPARG